MFDCSFPFYERKLRIFFIFLKIHIFVVDWLGFDRVFVIAVLALSNHAYTIYAMQNASSSIQRR